MYGIKIRKTSRKEKKEKNVELWGEVLQKTTGIESIKVKSP